MWALSRARSTARFRCFARDSGRFGEKRFQSRRSAKPEQRARRTTRRSILNISADLAVCDFRRQPDAAANQSDAANQRRRDFRTRFRQQSRTGRAANQQSERFEYGTGRADLMMLAPIVMGYLGKQKQGKISTRAVVKLARRAARADSKRAAGRIFKLDARPRRRRQHAGRHRFDGDELHDKQEIILEGRNRRQ